MTVTQRFLAPVLRLLVILGVLLFLARGVDVAQVAELASALPVSSLLAAFAHCLINILMGAFRWRAMMTAFGALRRPSFLDLFRATLATHFYNTFLPSGLGGDVVRSVVLRDAFAAPTTGLVSVVVERFIGLLALSLVAGLGFFLSPSLAPTEAYRPYLIVPVLLGVVALFALGLTGRVRTYLSSLLVVSQPVVLAQALGISVVGHGINIALYVLLCVGLGLDLDPMALFLVVPIALFATAIPLSVVGVGPREVVLVTLLGALGVATPSALVVTLGFSLVNVTVALLGGLLVLVQPSLLRYQ